MRGNLQRGFSRAGSVVLFQYVIIGKVEYTHYPCRKLIITVLYLIYIPSATIVLGMKLYL